MKKLLQDYPLSTLLAALSFYHSVFFEAFYLFFNSSCSDTHTDRQLIKSKMRIILYKNKQLFVIYTELYMELYTELFSKKTTELSLNLGCIFNNVLSYIFVNFKSMQNGSVEN